MASQSAPTRKPLKKPPLPNRITKTIRTDPVKDKRPIGVVLQEWTKDKKLRTGVRWSTLSDEEIKKVTSVRQANALGVPYAYAQQVVAQISRIVKARCVRRIATYQNGKLIRVSGPLVRVEQKKRA
jgi:hypothetical protein